MQGTRSGFMFVLALIMAGAAAWLANLWVQQQAAKTTAKVEVEVTKVVVAAMQVLQGQALEPQHVKLVDWPKNLLPSGAITELDQAVGKVARQIIMPDDVVSSVKVADSLEGSHLAALLGENKRAVSVRVDDVIGVAGFLLPGNHVDVLGARKDLRQDQVFVRTVVEDVVVLAVDQDTGGDESKPKIVRAVTLELTPIQTRDIVKASNEGKIQLALRNPTEKVAEVPPPPKPKTVPVARKPQPKPEPKVTEAPKPEQKVNVIRGLSLTAEKPKMDDGDSEEDDQTNNENGDKSVASIK